MVKKKGCLTGKRFVDLFAGIGGFHLAMESVGMECVFASEWDKHAAKVYEDNFGIRPHGDITKIDEGEIPTHDIVCGGFPCQAFSISGKRRGFEDTRGTLFFDVARIIKRHRPEVVFLENVRNFEVHDGGKTLSIVRRTLEDLGYAVSHKVINSATLGFPTARQRIYIVAFNTGKTNAGDFFCFPGESKKRARVSDCLMPLSKKDLGGLAIKGRHKIDQDLVAKAGERFGMRPSMPIRIGTIGNGGQGNRIYHPDGVGITLSAYGGGRAAKTGAYLVDGKVRKLHPRECARLMGFPESFRLPESRGQAYKQFGNSVVVGVVSAIARQIDAALSMATVKAGSRDGK